jgi:hypothetical protein
MEFMQFQGPTFTIEVPPTWFVASNPQFQALFLTKAGIDPIRANYAISLRPVEKDVTAQAVAQTAKENQQEQYPGYQIMEEIDFSEQGGMGFFRRYQWLNEQQNAPVIQMQAMFVVNQILYTLTATRSQPSNIANLDEIFDHMTASFRVVEN